MDILGYHVPLVAFNGAVSLIIAIAVVGAKALTERKRVDGTTPSEPSTVPAAVPIVSQAINGLAVQRAAILDSLYRGSLACESAMNAVSAGSADDVADACGSFVNNLKRRAPWLSQSMSERADELAAGFEKAISSLSKGERFDLDGLRSGVSTLRRQLEAEFRTSSGFSQR